MGFIWDLELVIWYFSDMAKTSTTESGKLVTASARQLHVAPRKMRLVTNLVKGLNAQDAIVQLEHANKKAAPMLVKLIKSAIANAKNNFSLDVDHLFIKSVTCDQGAVMKRYFPRARGSAFTIRRKLCHVNVILEERKAGKAAKSRFNIFSKRKKEKIEPSIDAKQEANIKPESEAPKKSQIFRSDEQIKMSKAQNKRRLFNRKSGE